MAKFTKVDAACNSLDDVVYLGNVAFSPYTGPGGATMQLYLEGLVDPAYLDAEFHNIVFDLEIIGSSTVKFVRHSAHRNGLEYGVPDTAGTGWRIIPNTDPVAGTITTKLQLRYASMTISNRRPLNGFSMPLGIIGIGPTETLNFKASITADKIIATLLKSCPLKIEIKSSERISGILR